MIFQSPPTAHTLASDPLPAQHLPEHNLHVKINTEHSYISKCICPPQCTYPGCMKKTGHCDAAHNIHQRWKLSN